MRIVGIGIVGESVAHLDSALQSEQLAPVTMSVDGNGQEAVKAAAGVNGVGGADAECVHLLTGAK